MQEVNLTVKKNLVDFDHTLPMIKTGEDFQFVVDSWDPESGIDKLEFESFWGTTDLRPNEGSVKFVESVSDETVYVTRQKLQSGPITLRKQTRMDPETGKPERRLVDYTLKIWMGDNFVAIDPPLDERPG